MLCICAIGTVTETHYLWFGLEFLNYYFFIYHGSLLRTQHYDRHPPASLLPQYLSSSSGCGSCPTDGRKALVCDGHVLLGSYEVGGCTDSLLMSC